MLIADKQSGGDHQGNSCTKVLLQGKENEKFILFSFDCFPSKPFNLQQPFPQNKEIKVVSFLLQKAFINPLKLQFTTSSRRLDGGAYCGAPVGGKCMVPKAKLVLYAFAV